MSHPSFDFASLSADTLAGLLDRMPVPAFFAQENSLSLNAAAEQFLGYLRAELGSLAELFEKLCPDSAGESLRHFVSDSISGVPFSRRYRIFCKDGSLREIVISGTGSSNDLYILNDISHSEKETALLKQSEARYRRLSELTSEYSHCCVRSGAEPFRVQWLGGGIEEVLGYSEREIFEIGCWLPLVHPEDRKRIAARLADMRPGQSSTDEFRVICKSGAIRWIRESCRCEAGETPDQMRLFGAAHDITEHKQTEASLKEIEEIFSLFLEYSPVHLMFKDKDHKILRASKSLEQLLGRPAGELIGKTVADFYPPHLAQKMILDNERVLRDALPVHSEEELDGRIYSTLKFPMMQNGRPQFVVVLKTEITERKMMEETISSLNLQLDRRVAERTAQLEAAILEQESFSYSVSHDLRAPLRHINSFSAILVEEFAEELPPAAQEYLTRIRAATGRMGVLIDDLLELSRVSRTQIQRTQVDLTRLALSVSRMLQETEPERKVTFSIAQNLSACCDPTLARQLIENLLGNAWKYTAKKPDARVEFGRSARLGGDVFCVKDNGAGFDMAYGDKLFHPFQRLHGAEFQGNGIGLATARRIVERHGGRIWAEGGVGLGASFSFTLP